MQPWHHDYAHPLRRRELHLDYAIANVTSAMEQVRKQLDAYHEAINRGLATAETAKTMLDAVEGKLRYLWRMLCTKAAIPPTSAEMYCSRHGVHPLGNPIHLTEPCEWHEE